MELSSEAHTLRGEPRLLRELQHNRTDPGVVHTWGDGTVTRSASRLSFELDGRKLLVYRDSLIAKLDELGV